MRSRFRRLISGTPFVVYAIAHLPVYIQSGRPRPSEGIGTAASATTTSRLCLKGALVLPNWSDARQGPPTQAQLEATDKPGLVRDSDRQRVSLWASNHVQNELRDVGPRYAQTA